MQNSIIFIYYPSYSHILFLNHQYYFIEHENAIVLFWFPFFHSYKKGCRIKVYVKGGELPFKMIL